LPANAGKNWKIKNLTAKNMKKSLIAFVIFCGGIACAIVYLNKQKLSPPVPAPVVESAPGQPTEQTPSGKIVAPKQEAPQTISADASEPAKISATTPVVGEVKPDDAADAIRQAVDGLLSAKNGPQKHELFQQLIKSGQIDQAIVELKQRALDNPNDAEIPTTLGEAQLNKVGAIHEAGGDINEQGILAMQADQSFNAALKIDPANFEAQLVKSISMTYWPAEPARDGQVVQTLSSLIDRQETMPSQPDFAQTYIYLGNEYQKIGQPDKAQATWQLGLTKFPNDPTLQKKISGP
jgi:hypothetical protein